MLSGCSTQKEQIKFDDAVLDAKIKVSRTSRTLLYPNSNCVDFKNKKRSVKVLNDNSWLGALDSNLNLGMPKTKDDFPSTAHEYAIPSGKPVTIDLYYISGNNVSTTYCGPFDISFTPESGGLYDVQLRFNDNKCYPLLRKLSKNASSSNEASAEIIKYSSAPHCE